MKENREVLDAIIVGGGPAGLSGALLLGRCRRQVALFDEGRPRNEASPAVHAFLGHEGIAPLELLRRGRQELASYPSVTIHQERVTEVQREEGCFRVFLKSGWEFKARALLVASGLVDRLPPIEGVEKFYGKSVHQCPYCDGWESSDKRLAALGPGNAGANLAIELTLWSDDVSLMLQGETPDSAILQDLARRQIRVVSSPPIRLLGQGKQLSEMECADGTRVPCDALFFVAEQSQHHHFLQSLGCECGDDSLAVCSPDGRTAIPGLYVAGNVTEGIQLALVAAAEGLKAGAAINEWLIATKPLSATALSLPG